MVQWLGIHPSTTGGMSLIPGQGTKILNAAGNGNNNKKKLSLKRENPILNIFIKLHHFLSLSSNRKCICRL